MRLSRYVHRHYRGNEYMAGHRITRLLLVVVGVLIALLVLLYVIGSDTSGGTAKHPTAVPVATP